MGKDFKYQGKTEKQYEDSDKIVFISILLIWIIIIGTVIYTWLS